MTSSSFVAAVRPSALRMTGVMSTNSRPAASRNARGPAMGSVARRPRARAPPPATARMADTPIGVSGRYSP